MGTFEVELWTRWVVALRLHNPIVKSYWQYEPFDQILLNKSNPIEQYVPNLARIAKSTQHF